MVTKGGTKHSHGSIAWRNICLAWNHIKPLLEPTPPENLDEWRSLPLWRPHVSHTSPNLAGCKTQAQLRIQEHGVSYIQDITTRTEEFLPWHLISPDCPNRLGSKTYDSLKANLRDVPHFPASPPVQTIFVENTTDLYEPHHQVWQFQISSCVHISQWTLATSNVWPEMAFYVKVGRLAKRSGDPPAPPINTRRVLVPAPVGKTQAAIHYGTWTSDFLSQYNWADSTSLLNTPSAQLRSLQARHQMSAHTKFAKWELALQHPIPENIWSSIWISYRGASENSHVSLAITVSSNRHPKVAFPHHTHY